MEGLGWEGVQHESGFSGQTGDPAQGEACSRAASPALSGARTAAGRRLTRREGKSSQIAKRIM